MLWAQRESVGFQGGSQADSDLGAARGTGAIHQGQSRPSPVQAAAGVGVYSWMQKPLSSANMAVNLLRQALSRALEMQRHVGLGHCP